MGDFYKIGVTNNTVKRRFGPDMKMISVIKTTSYTLGSEALKVEKKILEEWSEYLLRNTEAHPYQFEDVLSQNGNHEIFICDVLNLNAT